jgi:hypothetical protein
MAYQATYLLPLSLGFACLKVVRDCILVPARGTRSRCPAMHMRHLSFPRTAGDIQGWPERVFAPQRGLAIIGPVLRRGAAIAVSSHS